LLFFYTLPK